MRVSCHILKKKSKLLVFQIPNYINDGVDGIVDKEYGVDGIMDKEDSGDGIVDKEDGGDGIVDKENGGDGIVDKQDGGDGIVDKEVRTAQLLSISPSKIKNSKGSKY